MKKLMSLIMALVLCVSFASVAFAAEFVPSIDYKDSPDVLDAEMNDEDVSESVFITSIEDALKDPSSETNKQLTELYQNLQDGSMELPIDGDHVIRDMFDITVEGQEVSPEKPLTITLDLGLNKNDKIVILQYIDGEWVEVEFTVNPDGSVTCTFVSEGPVVVVNLTDKVQDTGDVDGQRMGLWMALMAICAVALVVVVANRRKFMAN